MSKTYDVWYSYHWYDHACLGADFKLSKPRTFRPCRHCGGDHYDNVCPTQTKTMMAEVKEEDEGSNTIELDDLDLETLQALESIQADEVTNEGEE